jgi:hypothetical protein
MGGDSPTVEPPEWHQVEEHERIHQKDGYRPHEDWHPRPWAYRPECNHGLGGEEIAQRTRDGYQRGTPGPTRSPFESAAASRRFSVAELFGIAVVEANLTVKGEGSQPHTAVPYLPFPEYRPTAQCDAPDSNAKDSSHERVAQLMSQQGQPCGREDQEQYPQPIRHVPKPQIRQFAEPIATNRHSSDFQGTDC